MNTELQAKLEASADKLIDFLEASGSATIDFTKEQVPLVVEEMLRWGWWSSAIACSIVSVLTLFLLAVVVWLWRDGVRISRLLKKDREAWEHEKAQNTTKGVWRFTEYYSRCDAEARLGDPSWRYMAAVLVAAFGCLIPAGALFHAATLVKITVAPRLYLIDQLKEIAK